MPPSSSSSSLLTHAHSSAYHSTKHVSPSTRQALLDWFDERRDDRAMPWRKRFDSSRSKEERGQRGYEIMIAEVMLQQTQVATVIGFYKRWMEKFPTIYDLAKGTNEEVHALWTGLGYYSRATRLLLAAQKVVSDYDGILPSTPKVLQVDIPGIGPYTAGAVASIAYGVQAPLIDGNVNRVFARLLGVYADPAKKVATTLMWDSAGDLVPQDRPGDWNEALMELGATVCKPTEAKCEECPLSGSCRAYSENSLNTPPKPPTDIEDLCDICSPFPSAPSTTLYPMKAIKKKAREEETAVCVVEWRYPEERKKESQWLVVKRPEKGLLAGLYEFPSLTLPSEPSPHPSPLLTPFLKKLINPSLPSGTKLSHLTHSHTPHAAVPHLFSHIAMTYHVSYLVLLAPTPSDDETANDPPEVERGVWLSGREEVEGCSMGTGGKKCWEAVWGGGGKGKKKAAMTKSKSSRKKGGSEDENDDEGGRQKKKGKVTQATISGFFKKREPVAFGGGGGGGGEKKEGGEVASSSSSSSVKKKPVGAVAGGKGQGIKASARRFVIVSEDEEEEEEVVVVVKEKDETIVVVTGEVGEKTGD